MQKVVVQPLKKVIAHPSYPKYWSRLIKTFLLVC